jgi:hypothetical protein
MPAPAAVSGGVDRHDGEVAAAAPQLAALGGHGRGAQHLLGGQLGAAAPRGREHDGGRLRQPEVAGDLAGDVEGERQRPDDGEHRTRLVGGAGDLGQPPQALDQRG